MKTKTNPMLKNHNHPRSPEQATMEIAAALGVFVKPPCSAEDGKSIALALLSFVKPLLDDMKEAGYDMNLAELESELLAIVAKRNEAKMNVPAAPGLN
jgi:hypothetical protein